MKNSCLFFLSASPLLLFADISNETSIFDEYEETEDFDSSVSKKPTEMKYVTISLKKEQNNKIGNSVTEISESALFKYRQPTDQNCNNWNFYGDYLYWKVGQDDSYYLLVPKVSFSPEQQLTWYSEGIGVYHSAIFDWNSGFRLGSGYIFKRDVWEILAEYTYYKTDGKNHVTRSDNPNRIINGTFTDLSISPLKQAFSDIYFRYDVLDLMLARRFLYGKEVIFDISTGLTGAWLTEDWNISYYDTANTFVKNKWDFNGGGFRAALDTDWHIGNGFGLVNRISFATLLGKYQNKNKVTLEIPPGLNTYINPLRNTLFKSTFLEPTLQFSLGMEWGKIFRDFSINIFIEGEANVWFDLHRTFRSDGVNKAIGDKIPIVDASSIGLYGLTSRLKFYF